MKTWKSSTLELDPAPSIGRESSSDSRRRRSLLFVNQYAYSCTCVVCARVCQCVSVCASVRVCRVVWCGVVCVCECVCACVRACVCVCLFLWMCVSASVGVCEGEIHKSILLKYMGLSVHQTSPKPLQVDS